MHSTNYTNTFIAIADDCKAIQGSLPPEKQPKTVAQLQFEMIANNPYRYTSDEVIFAIFAERNGIAVDEYAARRAEFFSKGQPCLRSSPLGKTYGWGIHYDSESRIAVYGCESSEYHQFQQDSKLKQLKAMKSAK
jgi:Family of unknown function (DUF6157)